VEQFGNLTGESAIRVGQASKVGFDRFLSAVSDEQGNQAPLSIRALRRCAMGQQLLFEALGTKGLTTPPAARVANDFLIPVIQGHGGSVGFDDETLAHEMWRGAVAIAIEVEAKILLHQSLGRVTVIRSESGQGSQTVWTEAIAGSLASFAVQSLVGHFLQPLPRLAIDIGEVSELAEGPEVLTNIPDAPAFDFSFLPAGGRIAGSWVKITLASKGQEAWIEADQGTDVLGDDRQKIVVPAFASDATQSLKSMEVATDESFKALAVGELDVEYPAVTLHQAEGIELPLVTGIVEGAEVAPVNFEAFTG
jgi:hypothetical protein